MKTKISIPVCDAEAAEAMNLALFYSLHCKQPEIIAYFVYLTHHYFETSLIISSSLPCSSKSLVRSALSNNAYACSNSTLRSDLNVLF